MEEKSLKVIDRRTETAPPPQSVLEIAIRKNADLATIEKLMELQERHERNEARKAYHKAMAAFKADPPKIFKTKRAGFSAKGSNVQYSYADLAQAAQAINRGLSEHGLSAGWLTDQADDGTIKVTCTITHEYGHSESTSMRAKPDESGAKNPIQAIGSTISYLERYTLFALTGLAAEGMDDDGHAGGTETISEDQQIEIQDLINEIYRDKGKKFLEWAKVDSVEDIPARDYKRIIGALNEAKRRKK